MDFDLYKRLHTAFNDIVYVDDVHEYHSKGKKGVSVTGLKKKFVEEFNGAYWSVYKALEKERPNSNVRSHKCKNVELNDIEVDGIASSYEYWATKCDFQAFLDQWEEKASKARNRGSFIHRYMELGKMGKRETSERVEACEKLLEHMANLIPIVLEGVCASPCRSVFGQYDALLYSLSTEQNVLADYKTDEEFSFENAYGDMMKYPLHFLPKCNGSEYMVQMNLYADFIEWATGIKIHRLVIYRIIEKENNFIEVDIPRIKLPFEEMLKNDNSRRIIHSTRGYEAVR